MAKIKLIDKVLKATELELEFDSLAVQRTVGGELVAILHLSTPIEQVRGSQEVEFNGKRIGLSASDVLEVKVHQDDFDGIEWDDATDTGHYKGSGLILDVSKQGQVWLRSTSFAASGQQMRRNNQNERLSKLISGLGIKVEDAKDVKEQQPAIVSGP